MQRYQVLYRDVAIFNDKAHEAIQSRVAESYCHTPEDFHRFLQEKGFRIEDRLIAAGAVLEIREVK